MQIGVGCVDKGMCLIQSSKAKKYTENSFIYYYLVRAVSGLPGYVNSFSTPVPGGMWGGPGLRSL